MTPRATIIALALFAFAGACKRESSSSSSTDASDRGSLQSETDANVRAAVAAEGCTVARTDGRLVWAKCGDAGVELSLNLENLDLAVKDISSPVERAAAARAFVKQLAMTSEQALPDRAPLEDLRLSIKPKETIEATYRRMTPEQREKNKLVSWPLAGDLLALAVIDRPDNIVTVGQPLLEKWKMTDAAIYAKAIENLDAHPLEPKRFDSDGVTLWALDDKEDAYESARLLSAKARGSLEKALGGKAVFAVPDREHLVAARANDRPAVEKLRALAALLAAGPYGISASVFEVDASGKLRVVP